MKCGLILTQYGVPCLQAVYNPMLKEYNRVLNSERSLIERRFGVLKNTFRIILKPFLFSKKLFPVVFRVCCKLHNELLKIQLHNSLRS